MTTMMLLVETCDLILKIYAITMWCHPLEDTNKQEFKVEIIGSLKEIDEEAVNNTFIHLSKA